MLEGGQSTEEGTDKYFAYCENETGECGTYEENREKRKEIFFNTVLAQNEIDRLFDAKALTKGTRYSKDGAQKVEEIYRDTDGTIRENLILKGNNLIALHSLKAQFAGKIKLIYIDPPYNTGNDGFKYNNNFNHSTWLVFMKNRLEVARQLLRDDGVIFVQCDDNEQAYLKVLMDEVFGRENFVNCIVWINNLKGRQISNVGACLTKEYCLCFAKNIHTIEEFYADVESLKKDMPSIYKGFNYKIYEDTVGRYVIKNGLNNTNSAFNQKTRPNLVYDIYYNPNTKDIVFTNPEDNDFIHIPPKRIADTSHFYAWRWNKEKVKKDINNLEFVIEGNTAKVYTKIRDFDITLFKDIIADINTSQGTNEIKALHLYEKFSYPKPEKYIKYLIHVTTKPGDIVLDYHLGSGTTCAVAHKMGRQYIGIEQMDYIESIAVARVRKVIEGEQGGISKAVQWQGGGSFIYAELAPWNEQAKETILACENLEALEGFFDAMYERYFLNYNVKVQEFKEKVLQEEAFRALSLDEHKRIFCAMLDNNQMYVCASEMADLLYNISTESQAMTKNFYEEE